MLRFCLTELPKPQLGDLKDLRALRMQPAPEDVLTLSQTLDKLLAGDSVQVELIPEKKGLFLKHVEYQLTSQVRGPSTRSTQTERSVLFPDSFCTFYHVSTEFEPRYISNSKPNVLCTCPPSDDLLLTLFLVF